MIYLTGVSTPLTQATKNPRLGVLAQPGNGVARTIHEYPCWAADNGCFGQRLHFNGQAWITWLARHDPHACLFAVVPDTVGDWAETSALWHQWSGHVRSIGLPLAYVAQDGVPADKVPWYELDVLFAGGSTQWKLSEPMYALAHEAKRRGKRTHMGRVNSWRRLRAAAHAGYDSADGNFLLRAPDENLPRLLRWLDRLERQPFLPERVELAHNSENSRAKER